MVQPLRERFRLAEWLVEPSLNRISREGRAVQIEPRAMDLLVFLACNAGRVVPRAEILEAVLERQFVADATLSHAVAQLRDALGDDARQPRYLETISKRGYRLIAAVENVSDTDTDTMEGEPTTRVPVALSGAPSIAVLPFFDMSPEGDQEYLCDGVVEEITNALARLDGLRVAARTSAFAFRGKLEDAREIGRKLAVGAVLEGSLRRAGDRLRITVQLINVADGFHLWSERFDGTDADIFAFEDDIALGVAERLKVKLLAGEAGALGRRHTSNREAFDLYLRGRYFVNRRRPGDFQVAITSFEQAIALDPAYASAHLGVAEAFTILALWGFLPPALACRRAKEAAEWAVAIDEGRFEGHAWLGSVLYLHEWNWQEAARQCERALELPASGGTEQFGVGLHLLVRHDWDRVRELEHRLVAMEPLSAAVHTQAGAILAGIGDHDAGAARTEKALELDPDMSVALHGLGFCRAAQGRFDAALPLLRAALDKGWTPSMYVLPEALVRLGRRAEALDLVRALDDTSRQRYVTPLIRALAWAALGEKERTLDLLAQAEADRSPLLILFLAGPGFRALAPEWVEEWFAALRRRVGLDSAIGGAVSSTRAPKVD
jgi:adenylate cyclase